MEFKMIYKIGKKEFKISHNDFIDTFFDICSEKEELAKMTNLISAGKASKFDSNNDYDVILSTCEYLNDRGKRIYLDSIIENAKRFSGSRSLSLSKIIEIMGKLSEEGKISKIRNFENQRLDIYKMN